METELTIGIATCGRPRVLRTCLKSLKNHLTIPYKLIILDNAKAFTDNEDAFISKLPDNAKLIEVKHKKIGCCESNNIIANACDTRYLMHMDDDVFLKEGGAIEDMLQEVKNTNNPCIIGGTWYDEYYGCHRHQSMKYILGVNNGQYILRKFPLPYAFTNAMDLDFIETDECLHSLIMDKDKVYGRVSWDNHYKWKGDRLDFFLQCSKADIELLTYCRKPFIHSPQPFKYGSLSYEDFGGKEAIEYFTKKWNIVPLVGWDGWQDKPR